MGTLSNVDSGKIRSTVNRLDGIVESMSGCINKFAEAVGALDKGWVSGVKAEFMARYRKDYEAMQEMLAQYREINAQLLDAAADLEKTESEVLGAVRALR